MRRGWSIDKRRVELEINALVLTVRVDGANPPALAMRSNLLGMWPIQVGDRGTTLRRVRSIDVARNELWVDGVKVPHSPQSMRWTPAKAGAPCKIHPGLAPAATIECGVCHAPVCAECCAVDGVRCRECFARAVEELRKQDRANRIKGPVISAVVIAAVWIVGLAAHVRVLLELAGGATALLAFLLIRGLIGERLEARKIPEPSGRGPSLASRPRP
jgi:hypothetical protein